MTGWRRAFCTSIAKERGDTVLKENSTNRSSKIGFFSNPSTPRLRSQPPETPTLRCRTTAATTPVLSVPNTPKLSQKPRFFQFASSNPSSPKSPSGFALIKSSLRLSRSRCGICLQSVKSGQGTAIFTAECSHSFHFPCISSHVKTRQILSCPICNSTWNDAPLLAIKNGEIEKQGETTKLRDQKPKTLKIYDDDEALVKSVNGARFNPIPESNEDEEEDVPTEFQGFFTTFAPSMPYPKVANVKRNFDVSLLPEAAVISAGRSSQIIAVVLKVKAPVIRSVSTKPANRAAIDVVVVVNVSASTNLVKLQMIKRALRMAISALCSTDRLSIVAFSATSKRLLPLRRMTTDGRRAARRIVDALCVVGKTTCVVDALKKAAKVIEDRREKNPVAAILLLSDGQDERIFSSVYSAQPTTFPLVSSTRLPHLDIPLHAVNFYSGMEPTEEILAETVAGLLSVGTQDIKLQLGLMSGSAPADIAGVYSLAGRPSSLGASTIRIADLYSGEERELLIELKVPASSIGSHLVLSVRSVYTEPTSHDLIRSKEQALVVPRISTVRSSSSTNERLRYLHVAIRGIAESRRLIERKDLSGAHHQLSSARALLMQRNSASAAEFIRSLEAELAELHRRWQHQSQRQKISCRNDDQVADQKAEALTPTSAWRAAERLAKVAIMRKSANRVSDLHGFENARF